MDGVLGLKGWQWLFLIEAVPADLLSGVVFFYLTDRPADATWLAPDERAWLVERLALERRQRQAVHNYSVAQALLNPKVLALSLVYFGAVATNYGLSFFLPQIVKAFGVSNVQTGLVAALPVCRRRVAIVLWGRRSDRKLERRFHLRLPAVRRRRRHRGLHALDDPRAEDDRLCDRRLRHLRLPAGVLDLAHGVLVRPAAAGGIAMINSIGNLAGFAGPFAMGWLKDQTGTYTGGLLTLAAPASWR